MFKGLKSMFNRKSDNTWLFAGAAMAGLVTLYGCNASGPTPPPAAAQSAAQRQNTQIPPSPPPPTRVPYYIAVATSMNTMEYAHGSDLVTTARAAFNLCEEQKKLRLSRGAYVAERECLLLPVVSNIEKTTVGHETINGVPCMAVFRNPV